MIFIQLNRPMTFYSVSPGDPECAPLQVQSEPRLNWMDHPLPAGTVMTAECRAGLKWFGVRSLNDPQWGARWIFLGDARVLSPLEALGATGE